MEKVYRSRGRPLPERLVPPLVYPGFASWLVDFRNLGSERYPGFGYRGPIPRSAIVARTEGWPAWEAELFIYVMESLDQIYLRHSVGEIDPDEDDRPISDNPARDTVRSALRR